MTLKQRFLKIVYPIYLRIQKNGRLSKVIVNKDGIAPSIPFYKLPVYLSNGDILQSEELNNKKILIVNTASDCGYTGQYRELQKLQDKFQNELLIIAFPSNDFKNQEKGSDEEIAAFCKINYGVAFPIAKKSKVIGDGRNEIFTWLSDKNLNGWNTKSPSWNFSKYLLNEKGILTHYFDPAVSPLSKNVLDAISGL